MEGIFDGANDPELRPSGHARPSGYATVERIIMADRQIEDVPSL